MTMGAVTGTTGAKRPRTETGGPAFKLSALGMHLLLEPVTEMVRHASTRLPFQAKATQRQAHCCASRPMHL